MFNFQSPNTMISQHYKEQQHSCLKCSLCSSFSMSIHRVTAIMDSSTVLKYFSAHPGLAIVKFWQGRVEIALRVAAIVSLS